MYCFDKYMNQSESFVDGFRPWYDCQSNIDIKFLHYSGNVKWPKLVEIAENSIGKSFFQLEIEYLK